MIGNIKAKKPKYKLNTNGEFIINNYNFSKPFANFFPGIAGKYGIPMWVFYVNRGQGIASFGTKDKDHAIVEFFPANKAWQLTPLTGFRTFIKVSKSRKTVFYEPFHNGFSNLGFDVTNTMSITSYDLKIAEDNHSLGININVEYFTIPNDSFAALVRIVKIKNTSKGIMMIQLIDGLPQIVPYGTNNLFLKKLGRTIEAWMNVENLDNKVPFYKLSVDPTDRPEVVHIKEGNFYLGFHYNNGRPQIIKPIVDPEMIFGSITDFSCPYKFIATKERFVYPKGQLTKNKTPCGFILLDFKLMQGEEKIFYSVIGNTRSLDALNSNVLRIIKPEYLIEKSSENKAIIRQLEQDIDTESESREFNLYVKQTYLDNIIRGGYPVVFKTSEGNSVFHLYSRKHGDLERDYNKFHIEPAYFSQGNGNYRDVNQNRRCDPWFYPEVEDDNILTFMNLIQTDGFNPLVIKGVTFSLIQQEGLKKSLAGLLTEADIAKIISFLDKPYTPGEIILFIEENKIKMGVSYDEFLSILIAHSVKNQEADYGEGYWIDHWTYNLDSIESYIGLYPEKLREVVFENRIFTFYDSSEIVKPRCHKYTLWYGRVRQLQSVVVDKTKSEMISHRTSFPHLVRTQNGKGEVYKTTLINKLLCIAVNKLASLDPFGMGIEMEANKPNWFDALNGLPALFGSSLCETLELKRLLLLIKELLLKCGIQKIFISQEICDFLIGLGNLLNEFLNSASMERDYRYWDASYSLKEDYRAKTKLGLSGNESEISADYLNVLIDNALIKLNIGIDKAMDKKQNIYYGYFYYEAAEFKRLNDHYVMPTRFIQKKLPFFLEAQVHTLRINDDIKKAKALYDGIKKSRLYDKKLKMYKVCAPLTDMPEEIGRCRSFTPGWLENESIWLHMEYKYLLELLRSGLYEEFYKDFKNCLIPFQKPARYGRNILENSSFLVSSAFPDSKLHGNGFVARLSGSTAELLSIWLTMNLGKNPFLVDNNNKLYLKFNPILPGWLFKHKDNTYSFNFLSKIRVVYHNPKRKNTFGKDAVTCKKIIFNDKDANPVEISGNTIPSPYAEQIRSRQVKHIDIYLG